MLVRLSVGGGWSQPKRISLRVINVSPVKSEPYPAAPLAAAGEISGPSRSRWLDIADAAERAIVLGLFSNFACNAIFGLIEHLSTVTVLLIASEVLPVILIVCRGRTKAMSLAPLDWVLAIAGTSAPLLVTTTGATVTILNVEVCALIMLVGLFTQLSAKIVLWRSFGIVAANRGVKVEGPYALVRHPMYLGYTVTHLGFFLSHPSIRTLFFYAITLSLQIARIMREERVLTRDPAYRTYTARVRYRLIPGLF
jgi:protein-S-isoprenylcysteine O-methyltransferase Ste14